MDPGFTTAKESEKVSAFWDTLMMMESPEI